MVPGEFNERGDRKVPETDTNTSCRPLGARTLPEKGPHTNPVLSGPCGSGCALGGGGGVDTA